MFTINRDLCVNCGICAKNCPMSIFYQDKTGTTAIREGSCLECFHCTAACPTGAITHEQLGAASLPADPSDNGLLAKLQRRRSIRHFKPDTPDRAVIQAALDGAAYAPSAKNERRYQWTVVLGSDAVDRLLALVLEYAKEQPHLRHLVWLHRQGINPITCGAPCLVLAYCPEDCSNPAVDCAIATTLAEELLNDAGLGTCWGGYFQRMSNAIPELKEALGIPKGHKVYTTLMVGLPDEHYSAIPHRPEAKIHWIE